MNIIAETELILTSENKIYHLNLTKNEIADTIILVGDPERVKLISNKFNSIEHKIQNREFITHTGTLNGKRISVIATGIGPDNIDIVVNELDALANINFETRTINTKKKTLNLIRLGTSGAIQKDIKVDTFIVSLFGLGFDNIAHFYESKEIINYDMSNKFKEFANWPEKLSNPYAVKASDNLLSLFPDIKKGITATAPGFYGPQGRTLRLNTHITNLHQKMERFNYNKNRITNFEMETSALYYLGQSLGHNTITICAIMANRLTKEYSNNYKETVEELIDITLKRIS
tara:strand:- start:1023 stop:1886 length:864 start_codon:yes stop_codon:yes gene_type:complete